MSEYNFCEIIERHANATNIVNTLSLEQIFCQAMKSDGCESTVVSFDCGCTEIAFKQNGDIVLTLQDVSVSSFFEHEHSDEDLDEVNIRISDRKIELLA